MAAGVSSWSKVRAAEDAGAAHGSTGKAGEQPGRPESFLLVLSVPLSFTFSKMPLKCWATASPLPVIREKSLLCAMGWHPQPGRWRRGVDGRWARQEGRRGSQTAQKAGDPSCTAALTNYTPCLLCCPVLPPQAPFPRRRPQVANLAIEAPGALCQDFTLVHYLINV